MKKALILLPLLLLTSCGESKQAVEVSRWNKSCENFDNFYTKDHIITFIEETTDEHVEELGVIRYYYAAQTEGKRNDLYSLYVETNVSYIVKFETMHKLKDLKWLVEYRYNDDYSYENVICYTQAEGENNL